MVFILSFGGDWHSFVTVSDIFYFIKGIFGKIEIHSLVLQVYPDSFIFVAVV